jgi:hypothetical protein
MELILYNNFKSDWRFSPDLQFIIILPHFIRVYIISPNKTTADAGRIQRDNLDTIERNYELIFACRKDVSACISIYVRTSQS